MHLQCMVRNCCKNVCVNAIAAKIYWYSLLYTCGRTSPLLVRWTLSVEPLTDYHVEVHSKAASYLYLLI